MFCCFILKTKPSKYYSVCEQAPLVFFFMNSHKLKYWLIVAGALTFRSWHSGCAPESVQISENVLLNVLLNWVIYGPWLWMALSPGPLRERSAWTSKEPRQLSSMPRSSAGQCWARPNLQADLVILPLWSHWNGLLTYCPRQERFCFFKKKKHVAGVITTFPWSPG